MAADFIIFLLFMLISLLSLVSMCKIQKNVCSKMRLGADHSTSEGGGGGG